MGRKRLTQLFPWLIPLRKKQRVLLFYAGMKMDGNDYAVKKADRRLPYILFETRSLLYNRETGFDMIYQENKVHNLKLAAATLNKLVIRPRETFSFWKIVRFADRSIPYKDGLIVVDGKLTTIPGGGMCQMSNLLFWMFLHTPLTIVERQGHAVKDFPDPPGNLLGVDATTLEGWIDLKVRNDTEQTFQIGISFEEESIKGCIYTDIEPDVSYVVENGEPVYFRDGDTLCEEVDILQRMVDPGTRIQRSQRRLYRNHCIIGYKMPPGTRIADQKEREQ